MPITSSAKKALRVSKRKRIFNVRRKRVMTDAIKTVEASASKKDGAKTLAAAYKAIDKAAKTGLIKKNTASRKKARVAKLFAKAGK